jgi:hypothetical protein
MNENNNDNQINPFDDRKDREDNILVGDNYELITKFSMEPNLGHYGYGDELNHINKNLLFTNLNRKYGEVDTVLRQLENITILKRHLRRKMLKQVKGYEKISETSDNVSVRPIVSEEEVTFHRFHNLIKYCSTKLYGTTSAAGGTDAKLLQMLRSTFINKEQTIEDRTETRNSFWGKMKGGQK